MAQGKTGLFERIIPAVAADLGGEVGDVVEALGRGDDLGVQGGDELLLEVAAGLVVPVLAGPLHAQAEGLEGVHQVGFGDREGHGGFKIQDSRSAGGGSASGDASGAGRSGVVSAASDSEPASSLPGAGAITPSVRGT